MWNTHQGPHNGADFLSDGVASTNNDAHKVPDGESNLTAFSQSECIADIQPERFPQQ